MRIGNAGFTTMISGNEPIMEIGTDDPAMRDWIPPAAAGERALTRFYGVTELAGFGSFSRGPVSPSSRAKPWFRRRSPLSWRASSSLITNSPTRPRSCSRSPREFDIQ